MKNPFEQVVGYKEILSDIEVLSKYGDDFADQRGTVNATVDRYHPKKLNLQVLEIIEETAFTKTFRLVSETGYLPPFQAGQYVNLFVETQGVRSSRPYSIAFDGTADPYGFTPFLDFRDNVLAPGDGHDRAASRGECTTQVVADTRGGARHQRDFSLVVHGPSLRLR